MESKNPVIRKIIDGIVNFKVIPFIGAGLSTGFGMKDWNSLIEDLKGELNTSLTDFLLVAQDFEDKFGREILINKLRNYYTIDDITKYDTSLHELLLAMSPPFVYTTNYDEAIELIASNIKRKYFKIVTLKNIIEAPHGSNQIIKFHGDFSAPEEIVLTKKDYDRRLELENPLDIQFRSNLLGKNLLFIGYSLRDKNINLVLSKHAKQYGIENLPVSYLITFDKYVTNEWTKDLESKNVKIISVISPSHLFDLIKILNKEVYLNFTNQEINSLFESRPSEVLLKNDLENLKDYWIDKSKSDGEKSSAIINTILRKRIPQNLEESVLGLLKDIINIEGYIKCKESVIELFRWLGLSAHNYVDLAIDLMELTVYDELNWGSTPTPSMTDVISTIELTLKRELTVFIIYVYLTKCYEEKRNLTFEHADRLFYFLGHLRYKDFYDAWTEKFPKENQEALIEHFLSQHPPVLRNRFSFPSLATRMTGSETAEYFLKLMGKR